MNDIKILADFLLVDDVAARMCWLVSPEGAGQAVRALHTLASDENTHPDDIMRAIRDLETAIGGVNLVAVMGHDLWDEWCPQPAGIDPLDYDKPDADGMIVWAGRKGYVKTAGELDETSNSQPVITLHSVRF